MDKRKDAREATFKLVFEYLFGRDKNSDTYDELVAEYKLDKEQQYVNSVYSGIIENFDTLSSLIEKSAKGFSIDRVFLVDKAIMLVALYEMKYMSDIPEKVSINEAIELAKKFSTEKSSSYINGILNSQMK